MEWTREKLTAKMAHERAIIFKNARAKNTPAAEALVKMIEELGLPYSDTACPTNDDPLTIAMYDVIQSAEGRRAMMEAVDQGLPPLAGVDPILANKLGADYGAHNTATATAGSLIAKLMRSLGLKEAGRSGAMPSRSVAKTGQMWRR